MFGMEDIQLYYILQCPVYQNIKGMDITFPCESDFGELGESNMSLPNILFRNLSAEFSTSGNCFCDSGTHIKL
jgi:hypothetical protein